MKVNKYRILDKETITLSDLGRAKIAALLLPDENGVKESQVCSPMELIEMSARARSVSKEDDQNYRVLNQIYIQLPMLRQWMLTNLVSFGEEMRLAAESLRLILFSEIRQGERADTPLIVSNGQYRKLIKQASEINRQNRETHQGLFLSGLEFYLAKRKNDGSAVCAGIEAVKEMDVSPELRRVAIALADDAAESIDPNEDNDKRLSIVKKMAEASAIQILRQALGLRDYVSDRVSIAFIRKHFPEVAEPLTEEVNSIIARCGKVDLNKEGKSYEFATWEDLAKLKIWRFKDRLENPKSHEIAVVFPTDGNTEDYVNHLRALAGVAVVYDCEGKVSPEAVSELEGEYLNIDRIALSDNSLRAVIPRVRLCLMRVLAGNAVLETLADVTGVDELKAFASTNEQLDGLLSDLRRMYEIVPDTVFGNQKERSRKVSLVKDNYCPEMVFSGYEINQDSVQMYRKNLMRHRKTLDYKQAIGDLPSVAHSFIQEVGK